MHHAFSFGIHAYRADMHKMKKQGRAPLRPGPDFVVKFVAE
jgi:hypothetical protein